MHTIRVRISGHAGSGKTTIAQVLSDALKQAKISHSVIDDEANPNPLDKRLAALRDADLKVVIETAHERTVPDSWSGPSQDDASAMDER